MIKAASLKREAAFLLRFLHDEEELDAKKRKTRLLSFSLPQSSSVFRLKKVMRWQSAPYGCIYLPQPSPLHFTSLQKMKEAYN